MTHPDHTATRTCDDQGEMSNKRLPHEQWPPRTAATTDHRHGHPDHQALADTPHHQDHRRAQHAHHDSPESPLHVHQGHHPGNDTTPRPGARRHTNDPPQNDDSTTAQPPLQRTVAPTNTTPSCTHHLQQNVAHRERTAPPEEPAQPHNAGHHSKTLHPSNTRGPSGGNHHNSADCQHGSHHHSDGDSP